MKKISLGLFLTIMSFFVQAQNGLESIIVETYYISNAADSIGSVGTLPVGSVTYRIYVDMLPGYKFQAAYGVPGHNLALTTTTSFFNNEDRGAVYPTYTKTQARANTVMLDSWLSVGAACANNFGILKSEDNTATGGATVINNTVPAILQNNDPLAGIPLTTHDGIFTVTGVVPEAVTVLGLNTALFDNVSQAGNSMTTNNGSWASLAGSTGPIPSTNKVLIAQITTDGVFHYELNIQIGTPSGGVENYVAQNPVGAEILLPGLMGTLGGPPNTPPTVNITAPSNGASFAVGNSVNITANAADADGTVSSVEFFVDGVSVGIDNSSPYSANYTAVAGPHTLTARATDNLGGQTTSSPVSITVSSNASPVVSVTTPGNGSTFITGSSVSITATATDDGSVASVEFFIDGISLSLDNSSPYSASYTITAGSHIITAVATDNLGLQTTSSPVNISAGSNIPPTVTITAPAGGSIFTAPSVVLITVDANDQDGTVSLVQFYINGVLAGTDATSPYTYSWTSVIGNANITAVAIDNLNGQTTSSAVSIIVADPNIPYKILTTSGTCLPTTFCIPLTAIDTVQDVIGYDIVLNFNKNKVLPTGNITLSSDLLSASYLDYITNADTANGLLFISIFFNSNAPANSSFSGLGDIGCIEFTKRASFASIDTVDFSIASLQESYYTGISFKTVDPGKYYTYKDSAFVASLKFWNSNVPLSYDLSNPNLYLATNIFGNNSTCNNQSSSATQPDTLGIFSYSISNGNYINIERQILSNTSVQPVINGFDVFFARKVLVNDLSFIPNVYQMIASDVNMDGVVSAGDVSQMNQRIVLMIPEFRQAWNYSSGGTSNGQLSKDWLFIDSTTINSTLAYAISSTYPNDDGIGFSKDRVPVASFCKQVPAVNVSSCPQISTEIYKGVLLGDINGSYATLGSGGLFKIDNDQKVVFDLYNSKIDNGNVDVPVWFSSEQAINSLDFSVMYNADNLKYVSVLNQSSNIQLLANYNEEDQTLRLTSNSLVNYEMNKPVLTLRFKLNSNEVKETDFSNVAGYLNGERVRVEWNTSKSQVNATDYWVKLYPNPTNSAINIEVSEEASFQLTDMNGRIISRFDNLNAFERVVVGVQDIPNGVYLVKIFNSRFSIVKRVVINK